MRESGGRVGGKRKGKERYRKRERKMEENEGRGWEKREEGRKREGDRKGEEKEGGREGGRGRREGERNGRERKRRVGEKGVEENRVQGKLSVLPINQQVQVNTPSCVPGGQRPEQTQSWMKRWSACKDVLRHE